MTHESSMPFNGGGSRHRSPAVSPRGKPQQRQTRLAALLLAVLLGGSIWVLYQRQSQQPRTDADAASIAAATGEPVNWEPLGDDAPRTIKALPRSGHKASKGASWGYPPLLPLACWQ